jgi:hypothetical protein
VAGPAQAGSGSIARFGTGLLYRLALGQGSQSRQSKRHQRQTGGLGDGVRGVAFATALIVTFAVTFVDCGVARGIGVALSGGRRVL